MNRGENRLVPTSADLVFQDLPNVSLGMSGRLSVKPDDDIKETFKMRSQILNWRIDEDADEFVFRISRKPEAPSLGHINVDVKIEGGFSTQPDGSVRFDGGLGNGEDNKVSKFSLSFEISHESSADSDSDSDSWETDYSQEEEEEQPEEHEIKFFHHPEHKLLLAPENQYDVDTGKATCDACWKSITKGNARWVYECPECDYCVHVKCAQLARTIRHPSHLKHSLKLLKVEPEFFRECDVCEAKISCGLYYNCARCNFDLHSECPDPEEARGDGEDDTVAAASEEAEEEVTEMSPLLMLMQSQLRLEMTQALADNIANLGAGVLSLS